jgi:hypothetical protein
MSTPLPLSFGMKNIDNAPISSLQSLHSFQHWNNYQGYWCVNGDSTITADLFTGTTGILHYLIRYLCPEQLAHPLSPSMHVNMAGIRPESTVLMM